MSWIEDVKTVTSAMLKKSFVFALTIIGSLAYAQNFEILPSQTVATDIDPAGVNELNITFSTKTPEAITYSWELLENTIPMSWDYSLCDYTACHIGIPATADMTRITLDEAKDGTLGFLKLNVINAYSNGDFKVSFYVYDSADHDRGDTVVFNYHNETVSIFDVVMDKELNVFPNPTSGDIIIETENIKSELTILNLTGQIIVQQTLEGIKEHEVSLSNMKSGVYMILLRSEGVLRKTKVLVTN